MSIHPKFPKSPYEIIKPEFRWIPADESLRESSFNKLLPPLVSKLRKRIYEWRGDNYEGISDISRYLLNWWFTQKHHINDHELFKYYFSQREAVETVIYLLERAKIKDKYDLLRFDESGCITPGYIDETWKRVVIKMATGSGKTKVISLLLVWSYFQKKYGQNSSFSTNFLVIAPNIIVLDRLRNDFEGLSIFFNDPILPDNGYEDFNWKNDFRLTLHIQDQVGVINPNGNIFLTNIHRIYDNSVSPLKENDENNLEYFLGKMPSKGSKSKIIDLGEIIRDVNDLVVFNDEAHHIHDSKLSWYKSIEDIHNNLKQKNSEISLQIDVTATPKDTNGAIFPQTISDYALVEAITQNVVKRPVLPDGPSRSRLRENESSKFTEKYSDYLDLGVKEWMKSYQEHKKVGKKSILFVMTDDTKNCDEVADYLEKKYVDLRNSVLTIHTNKNGEIKENAKGKKNLDELTKLRELSNQIDNWDNPYKVIVSVLMLKEGWDVRNVTTIVGLRAFNTPSRILPEQTLGRGLRRMYKGHEHEEYVSIVGTEAFMEFVESIETEGVELERKPMGERSKAITPLIVEVDEKKDKEKFDIKMPVLSPRISRKFKDLDKINIDKFDNEIVEIRNFSKDEIREIIFRDITTNEISHTTILDTNEVSDYRNIIGYFAQMILKDLRLYSSYKVLYPKVQEFIEHKLFGKTVNLNDQNILRNLSETKVTRIILDSFKTMINDLTIEDKGNVEIKDYIKTSNMRPIVVKNKSYLEPNKSIFNKIVGDNDFEFRVSKFLDKCDDIVSFAKNYYALKFKIDYLDKDGNISNYYPDFLVKKDENSFFIIETKGREDINDENKILRLKQWCTDINDIEDSINYDFIFINQDDFDNYSGFSGRSNNSLKSFQDLVLNFKKYK